MKKILITVSLATLALVFAGCQSTSAPTNTPSTDDTASEMTGETSSPAESMLSAVDQAILDGALELDDESYCDKAADVEAKNICRDTVMNERAKVQAVSEQNLQLCAQISDGEQREVCQIEVQVAIDKEKAAEEEAKKNAEEQAKMTKIAESGSHRECSELSSPEKVSDCEVNILLNLAVAENNIAICDQASTNATDKRCRDMFPSAKALNDSTSGGSPGN